MGRDRQGHRPFSAASLIGRLWQGLRPRWWPSADAELEREIRAHLELEAEEGIANGLSPGQARVAALRAFGNVTLIKEVCRDMRTVVSVQRIVQDLRFAWRQARRAPVFALATIVTLAIGIGVNTAVFTLFYAVAMRPLPLKDADRVISVFQEFHGRFDRRVSGAVELLSYPEYVAYRDRNHTLDGLAAYSEASVALTGTETQPAHASLVSCNYFEVLKAGTVLGRSFLPDECKVAGDSPVVVLANGFWRRQFGGDPRIVGSTVLMNRIGFSIIGVADAEFAGTELQEPDMWVPVTMQPSFKPKGPTVSEPNASWLSVVGRLKPHVTISQARTDLASIAQQMDADYPGRQTVVSVEAGTYVNGPQARNKGAFLAVAVLTTFGLVLLMACCNVMNLLLGRAAVRRREVGVRLAIGASRARLIQQLLTESVALAVIGGAAGLWVAQWLPRLLFMVVARPEFHPDLRPDLPVFAYAFALSAASALLFGLVPALWATRLDVSSLMTVEQTEVGRRIGRSKVRSLLVALQVAGCLPLLATAGLLTRGVLHAEAIDPGFATTDVLGVSFDLSQQGYTTERAAPFYHALVERLTAMAGANNVGVASSLPLGGRRSMSIRPGPAGEDATGNELVSFFTVVSGNYFQALRIPILRGRPFVDDEVRVGPPTPAVVSDALARALWHDRDAALGQQFHSMTTTYEVVGVANDVHNVDLSDPDGPFFYAAAAQSDLLNMMIVVRAPGRAAVIASAAPQLARGLDRSVLVTTERFEARLAQLTKESRTAALVSIWLGLFALLLACVGIYGVIDYGVRQRSREMGVRMALGALPKDIVWLVVRQGSPPVIGGLAAGALLAAASAQVIKGLLFGISSLDPIAYIATTGIIVVVAVIAMMLPARRAARVDPSFTLRLD